MTDGRTDRRTELLSRVMTLTTADFCYFLHDIYSIYFCRAINSTAKIFVGGNRVIAAVIGSAIVYWQYIAIFKNYVVYRSVGKQKYRHVFLSSLNFAMTKV